MTTAPANARLRKTRVLLAICLTYAAAMIAVAAYLASQHAWTQVALLSTTSVAPVTVSMSAYAAAKRGQPMTLAPRKKRLLLIALGGAVCLAAGIAGALLLAK